MSSKTPWNLLSLGAGPSGARNHAIVLSTLAAVLGALLAFGVLWPKVKRGRGRGVLLVQARKSYTVHLQYRESLAHNVRLFRFALPYPDQVGVP